MSIPAYIRNSIYDNTPKATPPERRIKLPDWMAKKSAQKQYDEDMSILESRMSKYL